MRVITLFSVTLIWLHAAVVVRVYTEETGTFPMVLDYHSVVMSMRLEGPKRLIFVVQAKENLVYIGVTYQPMQFMTTPI